MPGTPTVMILLDGFSRNYVSSSDTPNICRYLAAGREAQLENLFAYRGIETSLISGLPIAEHKVWLEYCIRDGYSSGKLEAGSRGLAEVLNLVDHTRSDLVRRTARTAVAHMFPSSASIRTPNIIPARMMRYFRESSRWGTDLFGNRLFTIYDRLDELGLTYIRLEPPRYARFQDIASALAAGIRRNEKHAFYFIKLSELDVFGHKFGPNSPSCLRYIRATDRHLGALIVSLAKALGDLNTVVISDHGMSKVTEYIDIHRMIQPFLGRGGRDFAYFIDSTIARFWFREEKCERAVRDAILRDPRILELTTADAQEIGISSVKRLYGDLIVYLPEGCVFHPDFFRESERPSGMHGYRSTRTDRPLLLFYPKPVQEVPQKVSFDNVRWLVERQAGWDGN